MKESPKILLLLTIQTFYKSLLTGLKWFFSSFQDKTEKTASGSKLTAWFLTMLVGFFVYYDKITDLYTLIAFCSLLCTLLIIWGIISWKDLENLAKILKNNKEEK